jgi:hypothetical protein
MVGGLLGGGHDASLRSWSMMPDDASEQEDRAAIYRESADKLRQLAAEVRFDLGRREQLLALAAAFDRLAARVEQSASTLIAERAEPIAAVVLSRRFL